MFFKELNDLKFLSKNLAKNLAKENHLKKLKELPKRNLAKNHLKNLVKENHPKKLKELLKRNLAKNLPKKEKNLLKEKEKN